MSLNLNQKKQLLESIDYIDDAMLSDTLSRVNTDAAVAGRAPARRTKSMYWLKQTAALVACTLLLSAIVPILTYVLRSPDTADGTTPSAGMSDGELEAQTVIEETDPYPGELGSAGLRYMINEDGTTASFIGWGDFSGNTAYIGSVYEGLPVTQMIFYEQREQQERLNEIYLTNPGYVEATIMPDDFTFPNIKHVIIPDSVEYLDAGVINQCDYIETLHIGAGVNEICGAIFFNTMRGENFRSITVSPDNKVYTEKGNCLIEIATKSLICGFGDSVIPDDGSVEIISILAFYNKTGLTSIVVPEGIIEIYGSAFSGNDELISISFPSTLQKLRPSIHGLPALTEFKFAGTVEQWTALAKSITSWQDVAVTQITCSDGVVEYEVDHLGRIIN